MGNLLDGIMNGTIKYDPNKKHKPKKIQCIRCVNECKKTDIYKLHDCEDFDPWVEGRLKTKRK